MVFKTLKQGMLQIVFPNVCVCCGRENTQHERQLCSFCLEERFEDANPENDIVSSDSLLPKGVIGQHALWKFDKDGDLQHLLHQLKYEQLTKIGIDLGRKLGQRLRKNPFLDKKIKCSETILVPVPLHYLKYRYRGFNQAFKVAQGFRQVWPKTNICDMDTVTRMKNTSTQTGFSLEKRLENMKAAFRLNTPSTLKAKFVLIIDDVFTTGATTFELAHTLKKADVHEIAILTIAQA